MHLSLTPAIGHKKRAPDRELLHEYHILSVLEAFIDVLLFPDDEERDARGCEDAEKQVRPVVDDEGRRRCHRGIIGKVKGRHI